MSVSGGVKGVGMKTPDKVYAKTRLKSLIHPIRDRIKDY
jgi:hypothetical protein